MLSNGNLFGLNEIRYFQITDTRIGRENKIDSVDCGQCKAQNIHYGRGMWETISDRSGWK